MPDYAVYVTVAMMIEADSSEEAAERGKVLENHMQVPDMPEATHIDWWPHYIDSSSVQVWQQGSKPEAQN